MQLPRPILYRLLGNDAAAVECERADKSLDLARRALIGLKKLFNQQPADTQPGLLNLTQAAKYLGYKPAGLRKACKRGDVRYTQVGRGPYRFRQEWLDEFIAGPSPEQPKRKRKACAAVSSHGFDPSLLKI